MINNPVLVNTKQLGSILKIPTAALWVIEKFLIVLEDD